MSKDAISVIVPVYNAQPHLARCIESIQNQTYSDFEMILVNDGSKDDSLTICQEYADKDERIRVIDKENEGASAARNSGLVAASGEYIMFIDSDDWIEPDMFQTLLQSLKRENADVAICNFYIEQSDSDHMDLLPMPFDKRVYVTENVLDGAAQLDNVGKFPYVWNRIYRRDIIELRRIRFDPMFVTGEDLDFNLKYFRHAKKCVILDMPLYHYLKYGTNSLCARYKENLYDTVMELNRRIYSFYCEANGDAKYRRIYEAKYIEYVATCVPNMYRNNAFMNKKDRLLLWSAMMEDACLEEYLREYQPSDVLLRLFKRTIMRNTSPKADRFYSILFWIRNNHPALYRILKHS